MDPRDRRRLAWIAACTTFLAAVVALGILVVLLDLILLHVG
jgi:type IV secretory pathway component VirB8